jgi:GTP-binding protein
MTAPTVAIVGRPNVGKSTLFNRIVGGRPAIVDDRPGVTRDRHFATADWNGRQFWLVDTGGWISGADELSGAIREQVEAAIHQADAIILVVDVNDGVHPADLEVAEILRPYSSRILVAANKCDSLPDDQSSFFAFHELGLGDPQPISSVTGKGSGDLLDRLVELLPEAAVRGGEGEIQVAVVGRPNVGKSSLVNRLLGQPRTVVATEPGTTRDAVDSPLRYHGRILNFIDTAGLRKRAKVEDEIEFYSSLRSMRAIERADVSVLVIDALEGVHAQEFKIAKTALDCGSGLILAVNKWDLVAEKDPSMAQRGQRAVVERAPFLKPHPFVYLSALTGFRARKLLELIVNIAEARETRVPTNEVNTVLESLVGRNQPPQAAGREVKLLYASQIGIRPPTFAVVSNRPDAIPESYRRYIERGFREAWAFEGVPIRVKYRRKRGRR